MGPRANRESSADNVRTMLASWHEWEIRDGERRIVLCVATPLELRPGFPGFDPMQLESLIRDATDMMRTSAARSTQFGLCPRGAETSVK